MKIRMASGFIGAAILTAPAGAAPYIVPSLVVAVLTDDNVLVSAEDRRKDVITRVSPGLSIGTDSERMVLNASYSQDMEAYQDNPDLDATDMRRFLQGEFIYRLSELILFSVDASYTESQFPAELNISTGAGEGRIKGERTEINPALTYRFSPTSSGQIDFRTSRDRLAGGVENDTNAFNLEYEHFLTANTQMTYGYTYSHFTFDSPETGVLELTEYVHAPRIGIAHNFSAFTSLSVQAGPSYSADEVGANIAIELLRDYGNGQFAIDYTRSAGTLIGEPGLVDLDAVTATLTHEFSNKFEVSSAISYGQVHSDRRDFSDDRVARATLSAIYRVNDYASVTASYSYSEQRLSMLNGSASIPRNVAMLALTFSYPRRSTPVTFNR
ncbi:MAG: outer membrane beta-barrel protein [Gammaproteobacteria bacterium]|nr:outer membrane beta-barrel protein [Gammaproteobacteria bacterium]MDP2140723.1 outer membrane beta-barrel protein [Gammaproteobacteria bacterium]MDP2346977.1 outer membrane beta-barrel protein [Gammaproteobacteria bacterium]